MTNLTDMWVLDENHDPRAVPYEEWARWMQQGFDKTKRVAKTAVSEEVEVSTVFLGLDHNFGDGPPVLFETMVFGGAHSEDLWRYCTWDEAVAGHERIVAALTDGRDPWEDVESR